MADTYHVFARSIFFNPEMTEKIQDNIERYTNYFTSVIRNIDVYLQEDQLMHKSVVFHWCLYQHTCLPVVNWDRVRCAISKMQCTLNLGRWKRKCWLSWRIDKRKTNMVYLTLLCIVLFPVYVHLNLMIWDMASTGSVLLLLMEMHFRLQITGLRGELQHLHLERRIRRPVQRWIHRGSQ